MRTLRLLSVLFLTAFPWGSAGAQQPPPAPEKPPAAAPEKPADPKDAKEKEEKAKLPEEPRKLNRAELKKALADLPKDYREWLDEVEVLMTAEERNAFLALEKDYQRDAFMERFWQARDPYKSTGRNELLEQWKARVAEAKEQFGSLKAERSRIFLLNGPPTAAWQVRCTTVLWPLDIWYYKGSDLAKFEFVIVFVQKWGVGEYRIWQPFDGLAALFVDGNMRADLNGVVSGCRDGDQVAGAISWVARQGMGYADIQARFDTRPKGPGGEWIASFGSYSTDLAADAPTFPAKLDVQFPGRYQARTVMQGVVTVQTADSEVAKLGDYRSYNFVLNGEVLEDKKKKLFDSFRYKFDFPVTEARESSLPLVFQRQLRPGDYLVILKIEDLNSGKFFREERRITVPQTDRNAPVAGPPADPETAKLLAEANAAIANGETTLKILRPPGDLLTGHVRFDTLTTGSGIEQVTFSLDGKAVLTKKRPPFSVELDLGALPRTRTLLASAVDAAGNLLTSDEMLINSSGHRFAVRLSEPQRGKRYQSSLLAQAEPLVPEGNAIERVEFYLNEDLVATAYQPPYTQPIVLPKNEALAYVRAVAYLTDGNSTEDLVFVNAPDNLEELKVQFVELYTSVLDRANRPVEGLAEKDFAVTEDGVKQQIVRFEKVTNLPIHTAIALDISASMDKNLDEARQAALKFFEQTVQPKDRAAFISFNDRPALAVKFTNDVKALAGGLAGLKAERGTALWDSIVFSLYYFNGIKGQRALLLFSDGKDEGSRFTFEDALEYARRAGVTIYVIGLGDVEKKRLTKIAEETGGRSFYVEGTETLEGIYASIEKELRSQYLIAYQSTNTGTDTNFRTVDLKVLQSGLEAKTIRGYYP